VDESSLTAAELPPLRALPVEEDADIPLKAIPVD
jgi:hypothetical protein